MTTSEAHPTKDTMHGSAMKGNGMAHGYRAKASSSKPPKSPAKPPTPPSGRGGGSK